MALAMSMETGMMLEERGVDSNKHRKNDGKKNDRKRKNDEQENKQDSETRIRLNG